MRQIRLRTRKARQASEYLDDLASAASGAVPRRTVAALAGAAAAGALLGTETEAAQADAATLATVRGRVSGPGVKNFSQCVVTLYETTSSSPPHIRPASAAGHYVIGSVPRGNWQAICTPGPHDQLAIVTYMRKAGYRTGTVIRITGAQTVYANFSMPAAGALQVIARNQAAAPVSGAIVWVAENGARAAALPPAVTDSSGPRSSHTFP